MENLKTGIKLGKSIVQEVNKKIKRTYWSNKRIHALFGRRSAKEIINDGTTCFMNPCLDLTLVSASLMKSKEMEYEMIIEEHLPTQDFNFNRLHFALEFEDKTGKYNINYKRCNFVYIKEGEYRGRRDIPRAQIIKIPGESIDPNKTIYANLGYESLEELCKKELRGYYLEKNLKRLKKDNTKENFLNYKKSFGKKFIINPKFLNQLST